MLRLARSTAQGRVMARGKPVASLPCQSLLPRSWAASRVAASRPPTKPDCGQALFRASPPLEPPVIVLLASLIGLGHRVSGHFWVWPPQLSAGACKRHL